MFSVISLLAAGNILDYVRENIIFFIIVAVCLLAIIVICTILSVAEKSAKKAAEAKEVQSEPDFEVKAETEAETESKTEKKAQVKAEEPVKAETEEPIAVAPTLKQKDKDSAKSAYAGKWIISQTVIVDEKGEELDGAYFFQLKASNGEALITSEEYASFHGAVQGIETFKVNIAKDNFKISVSKKGKYVVKLLNSQSFLLAKGEKYGTRAQALNAIASIKRFASSATRAEGVQVNALPFEACDEQAERNFDSKKKGKWLISKVLAEGEKTAVYPFELRASNGQVLFTSEDYASVNGAKNGIKTHKNNIEKGNIKAVITRNGDYTLKIYTAHGHLLCVGEHYSNKQRCLNAVESVKRFAKTAEIVVEEQ
ncbi:MAG: DUF1508 domain-containing protein [Clostridia bacterium]|nr:DUF1508 domain-containing protein [Clostridia bacterium]